MFAQLWIENVCTESTRIWAMRGVTMEEREQNKSSWIGPGMQTSVVVNSLYNRTGR